MLWCRDCPLRTALLASVLYFRSKQGLIGRAIGQADLERPLLDHKANDFIRSVALIYYTFWFGTGLYIQMRTFPPTFERIFEFQIKSDSPNTHTNITCTHTATIDDDNESTHTSLMSSWHKKGLWEQRELFELGRERMMTTVTWWHGWLLP